MARGILCRDSRVVIGAEGNDVRRRMRVVARSGRQVRWLLWGVGLALLAPALAAARVDAELPVPPGLRPQVEFWKKIFAEVSEWEAVIHDREDVRRIYRVVPLHGLRDSGADEAEIRARRREIVAAEIERVREQLLRLHTFRDEPARLSPEERRLAEMFAGERDPRRFLVAAEESRIRAQTGLRERMAEAVRIASRYLPYMESVFRGEGLPVALTRLPFVESSFDVTAYSRVGAAGLWQFMPATGRQFLRVDDVVDARRDPFAATVAAARYLKGHYAALGSWPVAVTAYNHGRGGMLRAVRQVGTTDIVEIIRRYDGPAFGFASKNFYAELIAVIEVERDAERYFGPIRREPPLVVDTFRVPDYVDFGELARIAPVDAQALIDLNLPLSAPVRRGELRVPRGYELRLPAGTAQEFRLRYAALPATAKHNGQRSVHTTHRVRAGETLSSIARRHGTSVQRLMADNGLRNPNHVRTGQVLKVRGAGGTAAPAASRAAAPAPGPVIHTVASGQTLSAIASRYGTTVAAICRLNGITNPNQVRAGDRLRIPSR